jgi:hypothetical protein
MMEQSKLPSKPWQGPPPIIGQQNFVGARPMERFWPGTTMALGILILLISFWSVGQWTFVTYMTLSKALALLAVAGNLLPYRSSGLRLGMERLEWFLFNVLAVGPILLSALLWVNFLVGGQRHTYFFHVSSNTDIHTYWIMHGGLPDTVVLDFQALDAQTLRSLEEIKEPLTSLTVARGCLGYDVIKAWGPLEVWRTSTPH